MYKRQDNDSTSHFQTIPMTVKRNAYGRQLGSFYTEEDFKGIGKIPMTFIRAPYVESVSDDVEVLATVENHIVAVQYNNQIALSFHPELDPDTRTVSYTHLDVYKRQHKTTKHCLYRNTDKNYSKR